jgi:phage N-6-adenine-methyltransferase
VSKISDECHTPPDFFAACERVWGPFTVDAAATCENALCERWCGVCSCSDDTHNMPQNGLDHLGAFGSSETAWINPPYSNILPWVEKALTAKRAVMLLPANTDTKWFSLIADHAIDVRFLRGRMTFTGPGTQYVDKTTGLLTSSTARGRHLVAMFDREQAELLGPAMRPRVTLSWDWRAEK